MAEVDRQADAGAEGEEEPGIPTMQKVAILFVALGQEACGEVMKFLSDHEIEEITQAVANLKTVSVEMQDEILEDIFIGALRQGLSVTLHRDKGRPRTTTLWLSTTAAGAGGGGSDGEQLCWVTFHPIRTRRAKRRARSTCAR